MKITLCGSARFEEHFHAWNEALTLSGHVVYSLAVYPSSKRGEKSWYTYTQKQSLDLAHLAKIEESDAVMVLDVDGYIGESTAREIEWAEVRDKAVLFAGAWLDGEYDELVPDLLREEPSAVLRTFMESRSVGADKVLEGSSIN